MLHRQKFAQNLVNFCPILEGFFLCYTGNSLQKFGEFLSHFWRVFSYATQATVCTKFGEFLNHLWEAMDFLKSFFPRQIFFYRP